MDYMRDYSAAKFLVIDIPKILTVIQGAIPRGLAPFAPNGIPASFINESLRQEGARPIVNAAFSVESFGETRPPFQGKCYSMQEWIRIIPAVRYLQYVPSRPADPPMLCAVRALFWTKCSSSGEPMGPIRSLPPKDILRRMPLSKFLVLILAVFGRTAMFIASEAYWCGQDTSEPRHPTAPDIQSPKIMLESFRSWLCKYSAQGFRLGIYPLPTYPVSYLVYLVIGGN
ncbi:hypothetical protein FIBSPDRAFT_881225 [Athelia psychrophila]|uniref:Uncharacterized protein n=1 Tax=Athelia psychrophila TaxID=1759441 RepID=A0A166XFW4_9AGAM|nr:hypothetical protein FIBSPDRAFT_881225 [Fibularhizoctonia sp. CBS 109695]